MRRTILVWTIAMFVVAAPVAAARGGGPKPSTPHGSQGSKGATSKGAQAPKPVTTGSKTHGAGAKTSTATTATTTTTPGTTTTLTPVQQKLLRNTNLATKLKTRLGGADVQLAAAGFRNLGQFVAAVNVSNNLGIPFAQLKTRMVDKSMSLGQAIQDARPTTTNTTTVVTRAERDADDLIRETENETAKPKKTVKSTAGGQK